MCLSTVYKNKKTDDAIVMKNVMSIECKDGLVILTDLMERQVAIEGTLEKANLVDGYVIVKEETQNPPCFSILPRMMATPFRPANGERPLGSGRWGLLPHSG